MLDFTVVTKCCLFCAYEQICKSKQKCGEVWRITSGKDKLFSEPPCELVKEGQWSGCSYQKNCEQLKIYREMASRDNDSEAEHTKRMGELQYYKNQYEGKKEAPREVL